MPDLKMTSKIAFVFALAGWLLIGCRPADAPVSTQVDIRPLEQVSVRGSPQIVDITATDAVLIFESNSPLACSVIYGETDAYGQVSVDQDMDGGAHTDHGPLLHGLEADTDTTTAYRGRHRTGHCTSARTRSSVRHRHRRMGLSIWLR